MDAVIIGKTEAKDDGDRFEVLDRVIERAEFWDDLAGRLGKSGKERADFLVAIKPNLMMFYSRRDMSVITEPALVEHLVDRLVDRGDGSRFPMKPRYRVVFGLRRATLSLFKLVSRFER